MKIVKVDARTPQHIIDGWGTSLCWWANAAGGWTMLGHSGREKREELMRLFFSEEGLDFNIVRYNIGGGDNPDETQHMFHFRGIPCFKASPDSAFEPHADWRQIWVLNRAYEMRKGDLITEAFVNSPPWWMTKSLCSGGNVRASDENLDRSRYGEFMEYCADVLAYIQNDLGIKIDYFDPMNEPASDYWEKGQRQEGNKVNPGEGQSQLLYAAYEKFRERKLDIAITGTDETNPKIALDSFRMLSGEVKEKILRKINYHHYQTDDEALKELRQITYPHGFDMPEYNLWMDEVCYGDGDDGYALAKNLIAAIHRDLTKAHANGWVIWQAMDTMSENILNHCHWGLIEGMYQDKNNNELEGVLDVSSMGFDLGDYVITMQYYVMGHYSKHIKQGYTILENDGDEFYCVSAMSPDQKTLIVVLSNDEARNKTVMLDLDGFLPQRAIKIVSDNERKWDMTELIDRFTHIELGPESIVTLQYKK